MAKRILRIALRWIAGILLLILSMIAWAYWHDQAGAGAPMGEQVTTSEEYLTSGIIAAAIGSSVNSRTTLIHESLAADTTHPSSTATNPGYTPYRYTRDAHAKGHGCVLASFRINKEVDARYSYGIFANSAHEYDALIRFSSGNPDTHADSVKDVRGMAIKVYNVPGQKLMPTEANGTSQDFILMNNKVFFIRTIEEYAEFNRFVADGHPFAYFLQGPFIWRWHLRELFLGIMAQKAPPDSLLTTQFYSGSSYALGPRQYVKYSVIPCTTNKIESGGASTGIDSASAAADYLRLELAKQSEKGGACFDFAVQPQVQGKNMPVEDTTVEWKESDSPFVPVARMVVKALKNNTAEMNEQCENTAFNPWHSLEDHKPVGVMNRVRQSLYLAMSRFRQTKNCSDNCEARCNSLKLPDNACVAQNPPVQAQ